MEHNTSQTIEHHEHNHHGHHDGSSSETKIAVSATVHCLIGCSIGEFIGLAVGVQLALSVAAIITLSTTLAFITGLGLTLIPIMRYQKMSFYSAFKIIWLGEVISIAVMEFAMNFVDYHVGGMTVASILNLRFWLGFLAALIAGFIAAFPVNYWMIKRNIKKCHI